MSLESDPSKIILRSEMIGRIREALKSRDWKQLEHWAKHWIELDPKFPNGFKWLGRACQAQNDLKRASYAFGRLLDFDPQNQEAKAFFKEYPSTQTPKLVPPQRLPVQQSSKHALDAQSRKQLSLLEFELAERYFNYGLFAQSANSYKNSYAWQPTQMAALGLAKSYHRQKQSFEALRFLRKRLEEFSDWIDGRIFLGHVLFDIGHLGEAQKEWQQVLRIDPKNQQALDCLRMLFTTLPK